MKKQDKILAIYPGIIIFLILVIWGSMSLNNFLTPFSMGDHYTPWETSELKSILKSDSYVLKGLPEEARSQYTDDRDNRYIVPLTFPAKTICWLFRRRVKLTFFASLMGLMLYVIYKIKYWKTKYPTSIQASLVLLHSLFFIMALWSNLCVRWWGYG